MLFTFGTTDCPGIDFRAPVETAVEREKGFVWLEAEGFAEYGDWVIDTQFTHKMGSAYLICPGANAARPHAARTTLALPRDGVWRVWARTKDWLPEFSPGTFTVAVNGTRGAVLGASRKGWGWEKAGDFTLKAGTVEIALQDLSGAYARCDALLLTTDLSFVPVEDEDASTVKGPLANPGAMRRRFAGVDETITEGGTFDVVVVGAGPGGMGASLGASRNGAKTALVYDRPVTGGNASSENGIGFDGASLGARNARETGVTEELRLTKVYLKRTYTDAFNAMAAKPNGPARFPNERVMRLEKVGARITAVLSRNTLTGRWTRWRAKLFVDSTGDGWLGLFAGARMMYGREAGGEYGEEWIAPKQRDALTMSGTLPWAVSEPCTEEVAWTTPAWARVLPKGFDRRIPGVGRPWWLEAPNRFDDLDDPETARDHLIRISFAYWGYLRNDWTAGRALVKHRRFVWPSIFNGRREGMRIVGDYVLTANDCKAGRRFEDAVTYGGWSLDTHDPLGMDNPHGDGWWHPHMGVPIYTVPFRALYSADVPNLLIGSRCQSMTHIALGSMRVQGTQMAAGQAAGTAAALCVRHGVEPRELGRTRIGELQQRLLRDDMYIPDVANTDPADLARTAKVTASSAFISSECGTDWVGKTAHAMSLARASSFKWSGKMTSFSCLLTNALDRAVTVKAKLVSVPRFNVLPEKGQVIAEVSAQAKPHRRDYVTFNVAPVTDASRVAPNCFVWVVLEPAPGVSWVLADSTYTGGIRAWRKGTDWQPVHGQQYCVRTDPALRTDGASGKPERVVDGTARQVDAAVHGWISDPDCALPQSIRLDFPKPVRAGEVALAFDSDLTPMRVKERMPKRLVKAYVVETRVNGTWRRVAEEEENFLRHRVHRFDPATIESVRITVNATWGDPSARIFEVRVYE